MKRFLIAAFCLLITGVAVTAYACGGAAAFLGPAKCFIVQVETGVGLCCHRVYHYGTWSSYEAADDWRKVNYPNESETTRVHVRQVELVNLKGSSK